MSRRPRLVVKVGSSLLAHSEALTLRYAFMHGLIEDIAALRRRGFDVILMSSGAVALGLNTLGKSAESACTADKQAAAACGQPLLLNAYRQISQEFRVDIAQVLLTMDDMEHQRRFGNIRTTIEQLFANDVVPIVNENDTVATEELRVGDNDRLAAKLAQMVGAEHLVILTSVDGLYDRNPSEPGAQFIAELTDVSEYLSVTEGTSALGSGGMKTKLQAANMAQQVGCTTYIAEGVVEHPITGVLDERRRHTRCSARPTPVSAEAGWLTNRLAVAGYLIVSDARARELSKARCRVEIEDLELVHGAFNAGDVVHVYDRTGEELARGMTNFSSSELQLMTRATASALDSLLPGNTAPSVVDAERLALVETHHLSWEAPEEVLDIIAA